MKFKPDLADAEKVALLWVRRYKGEPLVKSGEATKGFSTAESKPRYRRASEVTYLGHPDLPRFWFDYLNSLNDEWMKIRLGEAGINAIYADDTENDYRMSRHMELKLKRVYRMIACKHRNGR